METTNKGFTLVEMLVVISIIGILSSVILSGIDSAKNKAYDSRRMSDIEAISTAINMYFSDTGTYPPSGSTCATGDWPELFKAALVPKYIPKLPLDPQNELRVCVSPWNYYYGFNNPFAATWGTVCTPSAQKIVLYSVGRPSGKVFQDACSIGAAYRINTITFDK